MRLTLTKIAAAMLSVLALSGQATVLPYKNLDQLVQEADGIVVGTVRAVESAGARPADLHTFVTVEVQDVLSGQLSSTLLTLRLKGGFDGQRGLHIEGAPQFAPNERVLLFVRDNGRDLVPFVGWSQGVFRLVPDGATGRDRLLDADGNVVLGLRGSDLVREAGAESEVRLLGAPDLSSVRSARPEAGGGVTEDGSPVTEVEVRRAPIAPMTVERFMARVRERAGAGRALNSVTPQDLQPSAAVERDAAPARSEAARHPVARPELGGVAEPVRQPEVKEERQ